MTRSEWYKHRVLDGIIIVSEYADLVRDGAVESGLTPEESDTLYSMLCKLSVDISKSINEGIEE